MRVIPSEAPDEGATDGVADAAGAVLGPAEGATTIGGPEATGDPPDVTPWVTPRT